MKSYEWTVQRCCPVDFFSDGTLTIEQWVNIQGGYRLADRASRYEYFISAAAALYKSGLATTSDLRDEPRVGFDAGADKSYFIFKEDDNGTTYLVSEGKRGVSAQLIGDDGEATLTV